ncbi:MAG TPA: tetratricopeptide repeat protein, partial [Candidatus Obscuribacter sp.]|nr:tetratricopeptide repeat protein [Candidatus Obscuribacter sp.]
EDAEKLFQKALIEARRELARLRGDEMDGVVVAVSEELESSSPQVASGKKHSGGLAQASAEDDEQSAKPGLARRVKAPSDNSPEQMRVEDGLAQIFAGMAELYRVMGNLKEAESFAKQALALCESMYGADSMRAAQCLTKLGAAYRAQGRYSSVEPLLRRALTIYENEDLDHGEPLELAQMLETLADFLRAHGKYAQAEPLFQRALAKREACLGAEHPSIGNNLYNLAMLYHAEGKYEQAEPLYERAVRLFEEEWGPEHPSLATVLNYQAELYRSLGDFPRAEKIHWRALKIRQSVLGLEHPSTAQTLSNLALLFHVQCKYDQAEPLYKTLLEIRQKDWGPKHMHVAEVLNSLAEVYHDQGKFS